MSASLDALSWCLDQGLLPALTGPTLFFRPFPHPVLARFQPTGLHCAQTFRPISIALDRQGYQTVDDSLASAVDYATAVVAATRYKQENLFHLAAACQRLRSGGTLIVACPNDLGANSLERHAGALMGAVRSASKHKCRIIWGTKSTALREDLLGEWLQFGSLRTISGSVLKSRPGMFCWDRIDRGSALLARHLPTSLCGSGADLGCGYGYLSHELLLRDPQVTEIALYDAELSALQAAEANLAGISSNARLSFHWWDVSEGLSAGDLDWIVMNPPFHYGDQADVGLGKRFLQVAAHGLREGGLAYVVANQRLPYETCIKEGYSSGAVLAVAEGYKVLRLTR